jgi:hypothetical protein
MTLLQREVELALREQDQDACHHRERPRPDRDGPERESGEYQSGEERHRHVASGADPLGIGADLERSRFLPAGTAESL